MTGRSTRVVAELFRAACLAELDALKPGNVHIHAAGHGMTVADFVSSAEAAAPAIADAGLGVGERILTAVEATRAACGQNTNLGILLLCAPLAVAAHRAGDLRAGIERVLAGLDRRDAVLVFRAIRLAAPAGLGRSQRHDVAAEPSVTLLEAMREAAGRDRIAAQYASGFSDVLGTGIATLLGYRDAGWPEPWVVAGTYLTFLAAFSDTHVARKHGPETAAAVQAEAAGIEALLRTADRPEPLFGRLMALDSDLKRRGINPGTSADLTVASHFAAGLAAAIAAGSSSNHREIQS